MANKGISLKKCSDKFFTEIDRRTTGCCLPYGITQYYLPPDTSEHISHVSVKKTAFSIVR